MSPTVLHYTSPIITIQTDQTLLTPSPCAARRLSVSMSVTTPSPPTSTAISQRELPLSPAILDDKFSPPPVQRTPHYKRANSISNVSFEDGTNQRTAAVSYTLPTPARHSVVSLNPMTMTARQRPSVKHGVQI